MEDLLELLVGGVSKRMEILDYEFTIVAYVQIRLRKTNAHSSLSHSYSHPSFV